MVAVVECQRPLDARHRHGAGSGRWIWRSWGLPSTVSGWGLGTVAWGQDQALPRPDQVGIGADHPAVARGRSWTMRATSVGDAAAGAARRFARGCRRDAPTRWRGLPRAGPAGRAGTGNVRRCLSGRAGRSGAGPRADRAGGRAAAAGQRHAEAGRAGRRRADAGQHDSGDDGHTALGGQPRPAARASRRRRPRRRAGEPRGPASRWRTASRGDRRSSMTRCFRLLAFASGNAQNRRVSNICPQIVCDWPARA